MKEHDVPEHEPTKGERREAQRRNERKMRVTGRSVFLLQELGGKPKQKRGKRA